MVLIPESDFCSVANPLEPFAILAGSHEFCGEVCHLQHFSGSQHHKQASSRDVVPLLSVPVLVPISISKDCVILTP